MRKFYWVIYIGLPELHNEYTLIYPDIFYISFPFLFKGKKRSQVNRLLRIIFFFKLQIYSAQCQAAFQFIWYSERMKEKSLNKSHY